MRNQKHALTMMAPASSAPLVTPNDNEDLPLGTCNGLYVQTAGNLSYVDADGNTIAAFAVPANHYIIVQVKRVLETTSAAVQALY